MLNIGCHLSSSKGFYNMGKEALKINANTFQFFTRNPRGSKAKNIDENDINKLLKLMNENNFTKILAHAPYTLNCASADNKIREFAFMTMEDDLKRMEYIPGNMYNFHPGSHVGQGKEKGIELISDVLNNILKEEQTTTILLETMSGKGTEIGKNFKELKAIIDNVNLSHKIGICFDTCHMYDAGYDIVNNLDNALEEFNSIIGIDKLKAIHINDSKNPFGSHKDRHEKIGMGYIGLEAFKRIINHPLLRKLPFYLETPNELSGYAYEIELLKRNYN
ncbi:endonuclease IV [Tyzzerella sp. An114]|uniref:deoxyribonuclease IV n=1 Tax=Tyzzerella sp. An114 TaxID=1965545 RepID=UPI000B44D59F|nr:deoxyribonuclease IV [Tyzzerella sp. An114]OUQ56989.1 endonuclease IV [Tyzzerella sp. An114]